jgi:hypothetical protein
MCCFVTSEFATEFYQLVSNYFAVSKLLISTRPTNWLTFPPHQESESESEYVTKQKLAGLVTPQSLEAHNLAPPKLKYQSGFP